MRTAHSITANRILAAFALLVTGCSAGRPAGQGVYRNSVHGYTIVVPDGWNVRETENGSTYISHPTIRDANGVSATVFVMQVGKPEGFSFERDLADLPNQFTDYEERDHGTTNVLGLSYRWVRFSHIRDGRLHESLHTLLELEQAVITLACFGPREEFGGLERVFRRTAFSVRPASGRQ